ncbi:hypothetical protein [Cellulosimicrobium funkei]|uniref:hypothetical protein n=1 Tax=Cellulosimicrobium funkei TaxID=264251 RepID=UPI0036C571D8
MAAEQTAAQKAAEKQQPPTSDEKAEQEAKAAQEKAEQEAKAKTDQRPRAGAKSKGHKVTGAAVVLRTADKAERYLYRGAIVPDGAFTEDSIKHALSVGLIEKVK